MNSNIYVPYEVVKPRLTDIKAIATRNVEVYNYPTHQHYNWCCEQLGLNEKKVHPDILLDIEFWSGVQDLMVTACAKYLQENNIE